VLLLLGIATRTHLKKMNAANLSSVELVPATISGVDAIVTFNQTSLTA
jgi:hypothetical protein